MRRLLLAVIILGFALPSVSAGKSLYLVKGEYVDPGPLLPPDQLTGLLENLIFPSFEAMMKLEKEKKILAGGLLAGKRAVAFILEAKSNEEASQLVHDLPFWGILKWEVTPLERFDFRLKEDKKFLEELKKHAK